MPTAPPWIRAAERTAAKAVRRLRAARGANVQASPTVLTSTTGYQLAATLYRPEGTARLPAVVLCPGIDDGQAIFETHRAPVRAAEIARLGCVVATFDPAGRGASWGAEDFGGPEHQDNVCTVVEALAKRTDVQAERIGIVSISLGVSMAVGAAAGAHNPPAPVAWVLDWEGPSDRDIITAGGKKMAPAMGHSLDDDVYWQPREAVRHVGSLSCGYARLQSRVDHAQPGELRHSQRMVEAACAGTPAWVRLNHQPVASTPGGEVWLPPGQLSANSAILRAVRELIRTER